MQLLKTASITARIIALLDFISAVQRMIHFHVSFRLLQFVMSEVSDEVGEVGGVVKERNVVERDRPFDHIVTSN